MAGETRPMCETLEPGRSPAEGEKTSPARETGPCGALGTKETSSQSQGQADRPGTMTGNTHKLQRVSLTSLGEASLARVQPGLSVRGLKATDPRRRLRFHTRALHKYNVPRTVHSGPEKQNHLLKMQNGS